MKVRCVIFLLLFSPFSYAQIITTVAGSGVSGYSGDGIPATSAKLFQPSEIILDASGNLFIDDGYNHRIRKVDLFGVITTYVGTGLPGYNGDGGLADTTKISDGVGKVLVDIHGDLLFADANNQRIRKVNKATHIVTTIAGNGVAGYSSDGIPATAAQLNYPGHIAIDKIGNIYIADVLNKRVRKVDTFGIISTYAGTGMAGFSGDGGIADTAKFSTSIIGLACDTLGNVFVADRLNGRVRKIDFTTHIITTVAGNGTGTYAGEGIPATTQGICPGGLVVDSAGNLFIADFLNMRVYKVTPLGIIYSVGGTGVAGYNGDNGLADTSKLYTPYDVAFDPCGNLYIADANNERVRKVTFNPTCSPTLKTNLAREITEISIYPNPTNDVLFIGNVSIQTNYSLLSVEGVVMQKGELQADDNSISIRLLPPGVYMLVLTPFSYGEGHGEIRKIIKQ